MTTAPAEGVVQVYQVYPRGRVVGVGVNEDLMIMDVIDDSPAAEGGLREGQTIRRVNGIEVGDEEEYIDLMNDIMMDDVNAAVLFEVEEEKEGDGKGVGAATAFTSCHYFRRGSSPFPTSRGFYASAHTRPRRGSSPAELSSQQARAAAAGSSLALSTASAGAGGSPCRATSPYPPRAACQATPEQDAAAAGRMYHHLSMSQSQSRSLWTLCGDAEDSLSMNASSSSSREAEEDVGDALAPRGRLPRVADPPASPPTLRLAGGGAPAAPPPPHTQSQMLSGSRGSIASAARRAHLASTAHAPPSSAPREGTAASTREERTNADDGASDAADAWPSPTSGISTCGLAAGADADASSPIHLPAGVMSLADYSLAQRRQGLAPPPTAGTALPATFTLPDLPMYNSVWVAPLPPSAACAPTAGGAASAGDVFPTAAAGGDQFHTAPPTLPQGVASRLAATGLRNASRSEDGPQLREKRAASLGSLGPATGSKSLFGNARNLLRSLRKRKSCGDVQAARAAWQYAQAHHTHNDDDKAAPTVPTSPNITSPNIPDVPAMLPMPSAACCTRQPSAGCGNSVSESSTAAASISDGGDAGDGDTDESAGMSLSASSVNDADTVLTVPAASKAVAPHTKYMAAGGVRMAGTTTYLQAQTASVGSSLHPRAPATAAAAPPGGSSSSLGGAITGTRRDSAASSGSATSSRRGKMSAFMAKAKDAVDRKKRGRRGHDAAAASAPTVTSTPSATPSSSAGVHVAGGPAVVLREVYHTVVMVAAALPGPAVVDVGTSTRDRSGTPPGRCEVCGSATPMIDRQSFHARRLRSGSASSVFSPLTGPRGSPVSSPATGSVRPPWRSPHDTHVGSPCSPVSSNRGLSVTPPLEL